MRLAPARGWGVDLTLLITNGKKKSVKKIKGQSRDGRMRHASATSKSTRQARKEPRARQRMRPSAGWIKALLRDNKNFARCRTQCETERPSQDALPSGVLPSKCRVRGGELLVCLSTRSRSGTCPPSLSSQPRPRSRSNTGCDDIVADRRRGQSMPPFTEPDRWLDISLGVGWAAASH